MPFMKWIPPLTSYIAFTQQPNNPESSKTKCLPYWLAVKNIIIFMLIIEYLIKPNLKKIYLTQIKTDKLKKKKQTDKLLM